MNNFTIAFLMAAFAGACTCVGGAMALFAKRNNANFLSVSLGFSAGVMIFVSLTEIFSKARAALEGSFSERNSFLFALAAFFAGIALIWAIERFIPKPCGHGSGRLMRMGTLTALAIAIHNFPEGLATFVAAIRDPRLAVPIVAAIAIHNVPEGIAVAAPIYYASKSRPRAFLYALLSGVAEPVGALVGYAILMKFMSDAVYGALYAGVAGIMVYISVSELLPAACEYGGQGRSTAGLVAGMLVMGTSLMLFM